MKQRESENIEPCICGSDARMVSHVEDGPSYILCNRSITHGLSCWSGPEHRSRAWATRAWNRGMRLMRQAREMSDG